MTPHSNHHRPLGPTGLQVPPIVFGTSALGNVGRVITDQAKLAICGEWLKHVALPVCVTTSYEYGNGAALVALVRAFERLEVSPDEVNIHLKLSVDRVRETWEMSCRLLGDPFRPRLVSLPGNDADAWSLATELRTTREIGAVGLVVSKIEGTLAQVQALEPDWVAFSGCTVMRHSTETLRLTSEIARMDVPLIASGVFENGFLVGGNQLDGRTLDANRPSDRSLLTWRKSFVSLCDGHGVSPAHAAVQFVLALPGVVAVQLESSYADRVAENAKIACQPVPEQLWESMKEEGLLP